MPKKKKKKRKYKKKRKSSKKNKRSFRGKKSVKILKRKKKKRSKKKKIEKKETASELIIKTRPEWIKASLSNKAQYQKNYNESIKNNDSFWKKQGKRITWIKPYKKIKDVKYSSKEVKIKWFQDGTLNAAANCIDRRRSLVLDHSMNVSLIKKSVTQFLG